LPILTTGVFPTVWRMLANLVMVGSEVVRLAR
jgi:hypothetical protein